MGQQGLLPLSCTAHGCAHADECKAGCDAAHATLEEYIGPVVGRSQARGEEGKHSSAYPSAITGREGVNTSRGEVPQSPFLSEWFGGAKADNTAGDNAPEAHWSEAGTPRVDYASPRPHHQATQSTPMADSPRKTPRTLRESMQMEVYPMYADPSMAAVLPDPSSVH